MPELPPGEYMVLSIPEPAWCEPCGHIRFRIALNNEPVFSLDGEIVGIEGISRFEECGHGVPRCSVNPHGLAMMMESFEKDGPYSTGGWNVL